MILCCLCCLCCTSPGCGLHTSLCRFPATPHAFPSCLFPSACVLYIYIYVCEMETQASATSLIPVFWDDSEREADENHFNVLVKTFMPFISSSMPKENRGVITFVLNEYASKHKLYEEGCRRDINHVGKRASTQIHVKDSYLKGIRWLIAEQFASMLTSFSVCRGA